MIVNLGDYDTGDYWPGAGFRDLDAARHWVEVDAPALALSSSDLWEPGFAVVGRAGRVAGGALQKRPRGRVDLGCDGHIYDPGDRPRAL